MSNPTSMPVDLDKRRTTAEKFWARVLKTDTCWVWQGGTDENGYGRVGYQSRSNIGTHRVAWALTRNGGKIPTRWVLHRCDNPPCCNPAHLFLGDVSANNRDRHDKGRTAGFIRTGAGHHAFVVTDEMRDAMRFQRATGATQRSIADAFGVSRGHVAKLVAGTLPRNARGVS